MLQVVSLDLRSNTYSAIGMYTGILLHVICQDFILCIILFQRAWKNHLRTCQTENQITMYQTLCILIAEPSVTKFDVLLSQFIQHWEEKETTFIQYFQSSYSNRLGNYIVHHEKLLFCFLSLEKWAKCHRHFPHADTDTNMYLERYI